QAGSTQKKMAVAAGKGAIATLRMVLTVAIGLAAGFGLLVGASMWWASSRVMDTKEDEKAKDRIIIEEYYRKHGVRPGSRIEAEMLEAANQRAEIERREAENEVRRKEEAQQRFVEESRRVGDEVSRRMRDDEERIAGEKRAQEERKRYEEERREEAERRRIEYERRKLGLPSRPL
ncbi:MAG: hypothetical protein ACKVQK_17405, partial [Burkholderiales bacterium]